MMLEPFEFKEIAKHFPPHSGQFTDYLVNTVFLRSRYIFTEKRGKEQYGYCTHCKQEYITPGLRHLDLFICTSCGSECAVHASNRGRKYMVDDAYIVWYNKSEVDPSAITARGVYVVRDYRGDYRRVETVVEDRAMYLFEPGKGGMFIDRPLYYSSGRGMIVNQKWFSNKSVYSLAHTAMGNKPWHFSRENIQEVVKGTPFQYSTWESYRAYGDMVKFFDLYAKYPCIEYLTKLGFSEVVDTKLNGSQTYGAINWRAKDLPGVLRLSKKDLKDLRASNLRVTTWLLYLLQRAKKEGSSLTVKEIGALSIEISDSRADDLRKALSRTTLQKLAAYLVKQQRDPAVYKHYKSKGQLLSTWNDYIDDCLKLQLDLSQEVVRFPKNLYQAHQNTIQQIKYKEDEALRKKFADRNAALAKMRFEANGYLIRAAFDQKEIIEEGKALVHCVGGYAPRHAKGELDIFVLRKVAEPDKPFYTMEIRGGEIKQCRGLQNCAPTEEVQAFIDAFKEAKLVKKTDPKPEVQIELGVAV